MTGQTFDAVIFDLGGVLINLDYHLTSAAFVQLGLTDFDDVYSQMQQTDLFDRFETGDVSPFYFINRLLDRLPTGTNANQVVHAWNAMILDFPVKRLEWLTQFRRESGKKVVLLSNTNVLHMDAVRRSLQVATGHQRLEDYFDHVYLSHEMGMRKPHPETFIHLCTEQGFKPETTLFIDDSVQHVEGARKAGLQAVHLLPGLEVQGVFS